MDAYLLLRISRLSVAICRGLVKAAGVPANRDRGDRSPPANERDQLARTARQLLRFPFITRFQYRSWRNRRQHKAAGRHALWRLPRRHPLRVPARGQPSTPKCQRRSFRHTVFAMEEVLRPCRAGAWAGFGAGCMADALQHRPPRLGIGHRLDGLHRLFTRRLASGPGRRPTLRARTGNAP